MTVEIISAGGFAAGAPLQIGEIKTLPGIIEQDLVNRGYAAYLTESAPSWSYKNLPQFLILPPSGAANATGQITLGSALPLIPVGKARIYLPAGVVLAGSQGSGAGMYDVLFSSNTVCQILGNDIVTTSGSYTQTNAQVVLGQHAILGNSLGSNGVLKCTYVTSFSFTANGKVFGLSIGKSLATAQALSNAASTSATAGGCVSVAQMWNCGSASQQISQGSTSNIAGYGTFTVSPSQLNVDTSQDQTLFFTGRLVSSSDYFMYVARSVEIINA